MSKEKDVVFFVSGVKEKRKGQYLAHFVRTQEGIISATFDSRDQTLRVRYDSTSKDVDSIEDLTYFSDCSFISDSEEVSRCVGALRKIRLVDRFLTLSMLMTGFLLIYIMSGIMTNVNNSSTVCVLLAIMLSLVLLLGTWRLSLLNKKD